MPTKKSTASTINMFFYTWINIIYGNNNCNKKYFLLTSLENNTFRLLLKIKSVTDIWLFLFSSLFPTLVPNWLTFHLCFLSNRCEVSGRLYLKQTYNYCHQYAIHWKIFFINYFQHVTMFFTLLHSCIHIKENMKEENLRLHTKNTETAARTWWRILP